MKFNALNFKEYKQQKRKISMVTAYDYYTAQLANQANIDTILVGDSLGMVIQGNSTTLGVTIKDIIYHSKMVRKGAPDSFIIGDMPYLSYHNTIKQTIQNAGKLITHGYVDAVKLEVNHQATIKHIEALIQAQIPVIGHIGLTPQSINVLGGYKVQGKDSHQAKKLIMLAQAIEASQAQAIVLECIPYLLAKQITDTLTIPTIGIGSGVNCDGQVLVFHDLMGINPKVAKFVKQYAKCNATMLDALITFNQEVKDNSFPTLNHSFT